MKPVMRPDAEALAAAWVNGEVQPEDFDTRIKDWKLEEVIREAVKTGDLHRSQVSDEIDRRRDAGQFDAATMTFREKY